MAENRRTVKKTKRADRSSSSQDSNISFDASVTPAMEEDPSIRAIFKKTDPSNKDILEAQELIYKEGRQGGQQLAKVEKNVSALCAQIEDLKRTCCENPNCKNYPSQQ